jgi:hypothetical protein
MPDIGLLGRYTIEMSRIETVLIGKREFPPVGHARQGQTTQCTAKSLVSLERPSPFRSASHWSDSSNGKCDAKYGQKWNVACRNSSGSWKFVPFAGNLAP